MMIVFVDLKRLVKEGFLHYMGLFFIKPFEHNSPFYRLMIAQCLQEEMQFISNEALFLPKSTVKHLLSAGGISCAVDFVDSLDNKPYFGTHEIDNQNPIRQSPR
jgi:hypothetical protein